ncbi:MAG: DUF3788 family protein [candidate division Zixibacteria bacterium]|nr:DUF3788 family protein [candidate division Zixibacteria bacterium]
MAHSIFLDKAVEPTDKMVANALGKKLELWQAIVSMTEEICGEINPIWKMPMIKYGWSCRLMRKKRNMLYLVPQDGGFLIAFVFGEKAVAAIEETSISEDIKEELRNARKYVEGRGINFPVKFKKQLPDIRKLIEIKLKN